MENEPRIKIFGIPWHWGNQFEMLKLAKKYPVKFYWMKNNVRRISRYSARPEPTTWLSKDEFEWVTHYEKGKYDIAILHLDQQCASPLIGKGQLYRDLNEIITDIPKIVINHGTPMWDEFYTEDMVINGGLVRSSKGDIQIDGIKKMIGDNFMIVNSYDAVERWGWGYPLIHGIDPDEWWDLPKEPRVVISLSPGGLDKYYNRTLLTYIKADVKEKLGIDVIHTNIGPRWQMKDWDDYRETIGASLIYINPTLDSPMPRSRTEAMMSGCCILSSRYHGADEYIETGKNGFIMKDNPVSYAQTIHDLIMYAYKDAERIGQEGKKTAQKLFHIDRYHKDLFDIIVNVKDGKKPVWQGDKIWDK